MLVTLAALAGAAAWLSLRTQSYESTAQMLVTPLPQTDQTFLGLEVLRDSGDPTRTVQTAATLVKSRAAADRAAARLGGNWTGEKVLGAIQVEPQGESNVLAVKGKAATADEAARVANEFTRAALALRDAALRSQVNGAIARLRPSPSADAALLAEQAQRRDQLEAVRNDGDPTLSLSQRAVGATALGADKKLVIGLALLAGLALGSGAAILMEMTDRRVRSEEELLGLFPLPVLARIPVLSRRQRRAGGDASPWHMPPGVREGFRTLVAQLTGDHEGRSRTFMVTGSSTGDGKTTSAINLAVSLAASGKNVVLLDFDIRKPDVAASLSMEPMAGLAHFLDPSRRLSDLVQPAPYLPTLSVLPTGTEHGDEARVESMIHRLPDLVEQAREIASYVVVDTAPLGEVGDALNIVDDMDAVVIVARPGHSNRTNLLNMRDLLLRAAPTLAGFLLIGEAPGGSHGYYAYGVGARPIIKKAQEPA